MKISVVLYGCLMCKRCMVSAAEFLFAGCLNGKCQAQELMCVIQQSNLPPDQLMVSLDAAEMSIMLKDLMLITLFGKIA